MRTNATTGERLAAALSGAAAVFLSLGGAWYFVSAVWWLLRRDWPDWTWARLAGLGADRPETASTGAVWHFMAGLSPGATALAAAGVLAIAARILDPARRRR